MNKLSKQQILFGTVTIASVIGFLASFSQMLEKLELLKNPNATLFCNINSLFSCTNILGAWQSSVFGFPNALMCITFFTILLTAGIVGWSGGTIAKNFRFVLQGLALFFVGFGFWYLWQSIFVVGALCIYCLFCYAAVLSISSAMFRLNSADLQLSKQHRQSLDKFISNQYDILVWVLIALAIIVEITIKYI